MADETDIYRLVATIEGEEKVAQLAAAVSLAEQKYRAFQELQRAGRFDATTVDVQREAYAKLRDELGQARSALSELGRGGRESGEGLGAMAGGGRNSGMALMEISRAAEDAQYGLNGVLNNLPGLVMALGGSAGLVGVVSLVAVGAYQLYKHWDDLAGLFGGGHVKTAAEEMAELRKQTSLTADEAARLGQVDALKSKGKELQGGKTKEEKATEAAVTEAINEAGNENVVRFLGATEEGRAMIDQQGEAANVKARIAAKQQERDRLLRIVDSGADASGGAATRAGKLDDEIKAMTTGKGSELERARELTKQDKVSQAALVGEFGQKPLQDMIALLEKNPDKAPAGLLQSLRDATHEGRLAKERAEGSEDAEWDEFQEGNKEYTKRRKERQKEAQDKALALDDVAWEEFQDGNKEYTKNRKERTRDEKKAGKEQEKLREKAEQEDARARMDAPGLDEYLRDALLEGASPGDLGGMLSEMGFSPKEADALLGKGQKGAYEQLLKGDKESSSQVLGGGASLRDAIQAGVNNKDTGMEQVRRLAAIEGYLADIAAETRLSPGATFG